MSWSVLSFTKHKNKTLPQVLFTDPDWFFWAYENDVFSKNEALQKEATDIYHKSRNIKIQKPDHHAEFVFDGIRGVFADLKLVPTSRPKHVGTSITQRLDRIDMELIRHAKGYDKLGYQLLIISLKDILFQDSKVRITKKKAEDFFNNSSHFV